MQDMPHTQTLHCFSESVLHLPYKRAFDIIFSSLVLLIGLPVFMIIALIIRFSSKGSVVYSHQRIGRGGKPFRCYKFRSMYPDADKKLEELLKADPALKHEWDTTHKLRNDPRVTPIGAFLRKTSLDEIPQFWNVLIGDLSIVGPRPVVQAEIDKFYGSRAQKILSIRPGLTGIWQVSGRNDTSYENRVEMDESYIQQRSFIFDLKLIALTVPRMIFSKGAY